MDVNAKVQAWDFWFPRVGEVFEGPAFRCGMSGGCIAPPGTNRGNSRQDQTVINLAAYTALYDLRGALVVYTDEKYWRFDRFDELPADVREKTEHCYPAAP